RDPGNNPVSQRRKQGRAHAVEIPQGVSTEQLLTLTAGENAVYQGDEIEVPLIEIAHARSGDKGNPQELKLQGKTPVVMNVEDYG
ncbi:hypothetical protein ACTXQV_69400, partial [Klebsiella pneumoniae]